MDDSTNCADIVKECVALDDNGTFWLQNDKWTHSLVVLSKLIVIE